MARLTNEIRAAVKIGSEEAVFTLRQPTNKELNEFLARRYEYQNPRKMKDTSYQARVDLFDQLLLKVENLEDEQGVSITAERKEMIRSNWKADIIFRCFENEEIDIKN